MSWLWRSPKAAEGTKESPASDKKKSKPTKAHLGDKSKFYFNEKLKRWCVEGEEDKIEAEETFAPPPISRNVSTDYLSNQGADSGEESFGNNHLKGKPDPISLAESNNGNQTNGLPGSPRRGASLRQRYYDPGFMSGGGAGGGDSKGTSGSDQSAYAKELVPPTAEAPANKPITLFVPQMRNPNPEDSVSNRKSSVDNLNPPNFNSPWESEDYKTDADADADADALNGTGTTTITHKSEDFDSSSVVEGQVEHQTDLNEHQNQNDGAQALAFGEGGHGGDNGFGETIPDQYDYLEQQNAFQYENNNLMNNDMDQGDLAGAVENGEDRTAVDDYGYDKSETSDVFSSQPQPQKDTNMNQVHAEGFGYNSNYHTTNSSYDDFGSVQEHSAEGGGDEDGALRGALDNNIHSVAATTLGNNYNDNDETYNNGYNDANGTATGGEGLYYNGDTTAPDQQQQQQAQQHNHHQWHSVDSDSQLGLDQPYDVQSYDNSSNNNHNIHNNNMDHHQPQTNAAKLMHGGAETGGSLESSGGGAMISWEDHFQQLEQMASRVKRMEKERDEAQQELQKQRDLNKGQTTLALNTTLEASSSDQDAESSGAVKEDDFPSTPASQAIQVVSTPNPPSTTYSTMKRSLHEKIEELELNDLEKHKLLLENYRLQESLKLKDQDISSLQSDMNDLLVCLGQESAKVQALIPFAEPQLGEDVDSFLSKVEEESIADQAFAEEIEQEEQEQAGFGEVESMI